MLQLPMVQIKSNSFIEMTGKCFYEHENSPVLTVRKGGMWGSSDSSRKNNSITNMSNLKGATLTSHSQTNNLLWETS